MTILAVPGALGSVLAINGPAFQIGTAGVKVALRNLVIMPLPNSGAVHGIRMTAGAGLTVDNCLIANMPVNGIVVKPTRPCGSRTRRSGVIQEPVLCFGWGHTTITRTMIRGNVAQGIFAYVTTAGTFTAVDIAESTIDSNGAGLLGFIDFGLNAEVSMSIRDSRIVQNTSNGLAANGGIGGGTVALSASNNIISNNEGHGIVAINTGGRVWATGNTISYNDIGLWNTTGVLETAGNNAVRNNNTNKSGTITVIAME